MKALFSILVAWMLCGAVAAFFSFGPALLRIVAFGPDPAFHPSLTGISRPPTPANCRGRRPEASDTLSGL